MVRFIRDDVEILEFELSSTGAVTLLSGDPGWFDFGLLTELDGRVVSRTDDPVAWALGLQRGYEQTALSVGIELSDGEEVGVRPLRRRPLALLAIMLCMLLAGLGGLAAGNPKYYETAYKWALVKLGISHPTHKCPPGTLRLAHGCGLPPQLLQASDQVKTQISGPVVAARAAARELAGSGDGSIVAWDPKTGLWGAGGPPAWWQSALELRSLVRYLERTSTTDPSYQHLLLTTYRLNVRSPGTRRPRNFANQFMDDTAWWGLAWLEASRYELRVLHDNADASRFLAVAVWDAHYIEAHPHPCGGVEWQIGSRADTISNAEYATLAAGIGLYLEQPGAFLDRAASAQWLQKAQDSIDWMQRSGLIDESTGRTRDGLSRGCLPEGGPVTYTQGEVAEALITLGLALGEPSYFDRASTFLSFSITPGNGMTSDGILVQRCELLPDRCRLAVSPYNLTVFKGVLVQALSDFGAASGSGAYRQFIASQAQAVMQNAATDGRGRPGECVHPSGCQIGFYWAWPTRPAPAGPSGFGLTPGSQASGLDALTAALAQPPAG